MAEIFLDNKGLIPEKEWQSMIDALRQKAGEPGQALDSEHEMGKAQEKLHDTILNAVKQRLLLHKGQKVGVLFSGGVDSSLIAAMCKKLGSEDVVLYTAGYRDGKMALPPDIVAAEAMAGELGLKLRSQIFSYAEAREVISNAIKILGKNANAVNAGVGSVVIAANTLAEEDGIKVLFSGLGSEEIFAGYERHAKSQDIHEECWAGLKAMHSRDLVRDTIIAKQLGITLLTPFLDPEVIVAAMSVPASMKLKEGMGKHVLRVIAEPYLGERAWRRKKAAQYGSSFHKALERMAREEKLSIKGFLAKHADSQANL